MFQIDENSLADSKALISIQDKKSNISHRLKNGTINYTMEHNELWLTSPKVRKAYSKLDPNFRDFLDKILLARDGNLLDDELLFGKHVTFKDDVLINKNLNIKGNLLVEGDSTIIDTTTLTVEDNIVELNKNEISNGITKKLSGIAINRGTQKFIRNYFDETRKSFNIDLALKADDAPSNEWIVRAYAEAHENKEKGELEIKSLLTSPKATITEISSESINAKDLDIENNAKIGNQLSVLGKAIINNLLTVNGDTAISETLTVNGSTELNGATSVNNTLKVVSTSVFDKAMLINDKLTVSKSGILITGDSIFNNNLAIKNNATVTNDFTSKNIFSVNLTNREQLTTKNLTATTNAVIEELIVNANAIIKQDATIKRNLVVENNSILEGSLTVEGNTILNATLTIGNNVTANKNLLVNETCTIKGLLSANGGMNIAGSQTVSGTVTANDFLGNNYKLKPVDGNGIRFWNSDDSFKIHMSSTDNEIFGGAVAGASDSDYNMYFDMAQGANRGFVFKNNGVPMFHVESTGTIRAKGHMYSNGSKVLRVADEGHNNGIDADTLDGKHHSDLQAEFVNATGDKMTGTLLIERAHEQFKAKNGNNLVVISTSETNGDYLFGGKNADDNSDFIKHYIRIGENKLQYNTTSGNHNLYHEGHKPQWNEVESKPATYPPSEHNHNSIYYTKTETNAKHLEMENRMNDLESKLVKTSSHAVNVASWTLNNNTGYYEFTIAHNLNINIDTLDVKIFDVNGTSLIAQYDYVNNNSIKIYNDTAEELIVSISGITVNTRSSLKVLELEQRIIELEKLIIGG